MLSEMEICKALLGFVMALMSSSVMDAKEYYNPKSIDCTEHGFFLQEQQ